MGMFILSYCTKEVEIKRKQMNFPRSHKKLVAKTGLYTLIFVVTIFDVLVILAYSYY